MFSPMKCASCKKVIDIGEQYDAVRGSGYEIHLSCPPPPKRKPVWVVKSR